MGSRRLDRGAGARRAGGATGCSEPEPEASDTTDGTDTSTGTDDGSRADACPDLLACARESSLADLVPDEPTAAAGEPIVIGMINQENTPAGSFPELSRRRPGRRRVRQRAARRRRRSARRDRGLQHRVQRRGLDRVRASGSSQAGVPVVLGGIDVFGNGIDTLARQRHPLRRRHPGQHAVGRPAPNSFQWSGGTWGATVAFADYAATELEAERVAIVYGEFGSIADSAEYGERGARGARRRAGAAGAVPDHRDRPQLAPLQAAAADRPRRRDRARPPTPAARPAFDGVATARHRRPRCTTSGACAAPHDHRARPGRPRPTAPSSTSRGRSTATNPDPDFALYTAVVETLRRRPRPGRRRHGVVPVVHEPLRGAARARRRRLTPAAIIEALRGPGRRAELHGPPLHLRRRAVRRACPPLCSPAADPRPMEDGDARPGRRLDRRRRRSTARLRRSTSAPTSATCSPASAAARSSPSLALGLVLTYRTSGVVNFAHAAMGMYVAFAYFEFRDKRRPGAARSSASPTGSTCCATPTLATRAGRSRWSWRPLLGLVVYWLVFRPLRQAPPLARVVASLGPAPVPPGDRPAPVPGRRAPRWSRASRSCPRTRCAIFGTAVTPEPPAAGRCSSSWSLSCSPPCSATPGSVWRRGPRPATRRAPCCSASRPTGSAP